MGKVIPWHGKLNHDENKCPHCSSKSDYHNVRKVVMELSAQHYKKCNSCNGEFVDTYLITFDTDNGEHMWTCRKLWETGDHASIFNQLLLNGNLSYDEDNPNEDSDYYDVPLQSVHFLKET